MILWFYVYYIIIYIIPFPSKLSSPFSNGFDSVGMDYIKQGIQVNSLGILSVLFIKG